MTVLIRGALKTTATTRQFPTRPSRKTKASIAHNPKKIDYVNTKSFISSLRVNVLGLCGGKVLLTSQAIDCGNNGRMAVEIIFIALLLTGIDGRQGCIGPLPVSRDDLVVTGQGSGGRFCYLEIVRPIHHLHVHGRLSIVSKEI